MKTLRLPITIAMVIVTSGFFGSAASAQSRMIVNPVSDAAVQQYWTAERMASARPLTPMVNYDLAATFDPGSEATGAPVQTEAWSPSGAVPMTPKQLYDPNSVQIEAEAPDAVQPNMFGTLLARFTHSRLLPTSSNTTYPNRTVGKLFFTTPSGGAVCSASIIRHRIIVTAGHCVHSGNGSASGFYSSWLFVPALNGASAPYGPYTWAAAIVTGTWFSGGGAVPNAADYAFIELNDVAGVRIGVRLGYLGWITLNLSNNHASMMGYPCNLDSCMVMQRTDAQTHSYGGNNTYRFGSLMRGGASGGPWVQNYGTSPACTSGCTGSSSGRNQVIAVTSYGPVATTPLYLGASVPDSRWSSMYTTICARRVGNCS